MSLLGAIFVLISLASLAVGQPVYIPPPTLDPGWLKKNALVLHNEIVHHRFGFIIGVARSGTSVLKLLLDQHPRMSTMWNTSNIENEGQFATSLLPPSTKMNNMWHYAYDRRAHVTESSPLVTIANRNMVYAEWRRYWDVSKPILIEKSPTHSLRARFFQALFHAERTFFMVVLRHPFATMRDRWEKNGGREWLDCGDYAIAHWLKISETMMKDLEHIENKVAFHFELFALGEPQGTMDSLLTYFDIDPLVRVQVAKPPRSRSRREYRGDRDDVVVHPELTYSWVESLAEFTEWLNKNNSCIDVYSKYESRVNALGYSLLDLRAILPSKIVAPFLLHDMPIETKIRL